MMQAVCSGLAWKMCFAWSHTADLLWIEVHMRREEKEYNVAVMRVNSVHA
jgi:hypothetical protein